MSRYEFERCTTCTTGEVCGSRGYQPARNVSDATMTAALEAGTDLVVVECQRTDCAPIACDGGPFRLGHPHHDGDGPCPTCGGAS